MILKTFTTINGTSLCWFEWYLRAPIYLNVEKAKEMIMNELESLHKENKTPKIKFKDLYKGNTEWSKTFFQAGKELDRISENINMSVKGGFHQVELTT